ncbi:MAG: Tfp pilus assembly protein FimT/FimU [Candidatus Methylomirabilales bacterium]
MSRWIRRMGNKGVTLIELLVAIVIAGLLIGLGIPSLLPLIQGSELNGATRQVMYEIRAVQSLAVTRGGFFGLHWGGDPLVGFPPSQYRIEADPTGTCGWPAPTDSTATNANVIRDWLDLVNEYPAVTIQSVTDNVGTVLGGVMFNSRGAAVNTCGVALTFPLTVTMADAAGATQTITVQRAGRVTIP